MSLYVEQTGESCSLGPNQSCLMDRCGSNCTAKFDRMHPCLYCKFVEKTAILKE